MMCRSLQRATGTRWSSGSVGKRGRSRPTVRDCSRPSASSNMLARRTGLQVSALSAWSSAGSRSAFVDWSSQQYRICCVALVDRRH
eukprot:48991-Eustigmatos_ZCMA.PRE.1